MKNLIMGVCLIVLLNSCSTTRINPGNTVYKLTYDKKADENQLQSFTLKKNEDDFSPNSDNIVILSPFTTIVDSASKKVLKFKFMPSLQASVMENYFFTDVSAFVPVSKKDFPDEDVHSFPVAKKLTYTKSYFVLQGLTVPYKIRSKLTGAQYPSNQVFNTVETGFTANISLGYKFSWNIFRPVKDPVLGLNTYSFSITPGIFTGLGTVALSNSNTINLPGSYGAAFNRTALTKSFGVFTLFGISRFGFGYAGGFDYASGDGAGNWIYKGKWWNGVALSIDLVNF
jgi:hypothetical protein